MQIAPEVIEIKSRAARAGIDIADVLVRANVARTTWWRWTEEHYEPRLKTLRTVREALDELVAEKKRRR